MRIKKSEQTHIDGLGDKWTRALAKASLSVRLNPKLVGLDKIREPLATRAALKATGAPGIDGFCIPETAGIPMREMQDIVDAAFTEAVNAAKLENA